MPQEQLDLGKLRQLEKRRFEVVDNLCDSMDEFVGNAAVLGHEELAGELRWLNQLATEASEVRGKLASVLESYGDAKAEVMHKAGIWADWREVDEAEHRDANRRIEEVVGQVLRH